jgi:hypothetical protein
LFHLKNSPGHVLGRKEGKAMAYVWIARPPHPPTLDEQARANFWDAIQKLSLLFGLVFTIRSLLK